MRRAWLAIPVLLLASMGVGAAAVGLRARSAAGSREAAKSPRVVIEVINATTSRGLAKRAATVLRAGGFDVVSLGTAKTLQDTTLVLDRSGHPEWARRVGSALHRGGGAPPRIEERPDTSRYLDITVVLGATWRPPAEPFNP